MDHDKFARIEVQSSAEVWSWLDANHTMLESVWLVTWKASHRDRYVGRDDVLDALIAYGWIDGRRLKLDEDRTMQLISPRKQQAWALTYKERAERLGGEGRMHAAGLASIHAAKAGGRWDETADVDALVVPDVLLNALAADPDAHRFFEAAAPSYRRNVLRWLHLAKRAETRQERIAKIQSFSARQEKLPQM